MKTKGSNLTPVGSQEALRLADWINAEAEAEAQSAGTSAVGTSAFCYKCGRIAVALKQLAALTNSSTEQGLCCEVDGPAVPTGRELASINKQSTAHSWPFDKDSVYGYGPEPIPQTE
jgi:hypothetical protein